MNVFPPRVKTYSGYMSSCLVSTVFAGSDCSSKLVQSVLGTHMSLLASRIHNLCTYFHFFSPSSLRLFAILVSVPTSFVLQFCCASSQRVNGIAKVDAAFTGICQFLTAEIIQFPLDELIIAIIP